MRFWRSCNNSMPRPKTANWWKPGAVSSRVLCMKVATEIRIGEAGHCGADIRSDVYVRVEPRDRGGLQIDLESRVNTYYGDSIRKQAEEVLEALGVRDAQVVIRDEGALPFVIAARIEAAVRRAGLGAGTRVLPDSVALPKAS